MRFGRTTTAIGCSALLGMIVAVSPACQRAAAEDFAQHYLKGVEAYRAKDFITSAEEFKAALQLSPDHIGAMYNLACVMALEGKSAEAIERLNRIVRKGVDPGIADDEDLKSLHAEEGFKQILRTVDRLHAPITHSSTAFSLPEKDLITEGVAYDSVMNTFYVSSVHKRKVVCIDGDGRVRDLVAEGEDSIWCCLGMAVDPSRRTLWVTSTALPEMEGYDAKDEGVSGVFRFDLRNGRLSEKYVLSNAAGLHNLNDIAIGPHGEVYLTDGRSNGMYVIEPNIDRLRPFVQSPEITSPQGIAVTNDGRTLYVASYGHGIFLIDVATKNVSRLTHPDTVNVAGIDGLCLYRGSLICIQNGVRPHRVIRLFLDGEGRRVERMEILEANNPQFDEPTLGVVAKGTYYYIANSQWGMFDRKSKTFPKERLHSPVVLKMKV